MTIELHALIHTYGHDCITAPLDDDGDPMLGTYWQLVRPDGDPVTELMGPYADKAAAERACNRAYHSNDY